MTPKKIICIDPGKNGGVAFRSPAGEVHAVAMPETVHDLADLLFYELTFPLESVEAVVERVHSMPSDAASAAFAFGENFGAVQGVLASLRIPYRFVNPHQWQKKVGTLPKDKPERKRALKAFAQQRYPHIKVTLKTADALAMLAVETEGAS